METDNEPHRAYGNFMTPQVPRRVGISDAGRLSMGGSARRVLVEQKWRVKDIEVPPPIQEIKEEDHTLDGGLSTPLGSRGRGRDRLSEEERKVDISLLSTVLFAHGSDIGHPRTTAFCAADPRSLLRRSNTWHPPFPWFPCVSNQTHL